MKPFFRDPFVALLACGYLAAGAAPARAFYWGSWPGSNLRVAAAAATATPGLAGVGSASPAGVGAAQPGGGTVEIKADPLAGGLGAGTAGGGGGGNAGATGPGAESGSGSPNAGGGVVLVSGAPEPPSGVPEPATLVSGIIALGLAGAWKCRRAK